MQTKQKNHKHKFSWTYYSLREIGFSCSCGARKKRPPTTAEKKRFARQQKEMMARCDQMHKVWHEFCRKFSGQGGYELSEKVEKWALKYPKDVFICRIDDDYHMGSDLVFILHRIKNRNWGTTVVVIPQCENTYHSYFMYPSHLKGICQVLNKINCMKGLR